MLQWLVYGVYGFCQCFVEIFGMIYLLAVQVSQNAI